MSALLVPWPRSGERASVEILSQVFILITILLVALGVVLAVVVADAALGAGFRRWDRKREQHYDDIALRLWDRNDRPAYRDFKNHALKRHIYYQDYVGYLQYPYEGKYFNINEHGFRAPTFSLRNTDGRYRVVILGASALVGIPNCADDEIISHHLQRRLIEAGVNVEVINAAVRSFRIPNELNLAYRLHNTMDFDAIIVYDGYNDFLLGSVGNLYNGYPRVYDYVTAAWDARASGDVDWFDGQARLLRRLRRKKMFTRHVPNITRLSAYLARWLSPAGSEKAGDIGGLSLRYSDEARRIYLNHAQYLMLFARHYGKPLMFVHQPALLSSTKSLHPNEDLFRRYLRRASYKSDVAERTFRDSYRKQIDELADLCRRNGVPFIDGQTVVDAMSAEEDVFFDGVHMNSCGNKAVADAMGAIVKTWPQRSELRMLKAGK